MSDPVVRKGWRKTRDGWEPVADGPLARPLPAEDFAALDDSLTATEARIKRAVGIHSRRLELAAESPTGLDGAEVAALSTIAGIYKTLAVTTAPFDPAKLSDEDMDRLMKHLEKAK